MAERTNIGWCDATFNPWIGCQHVSPACDNCYAETQNAHRKWNGGEWGPHAPRKRTSDANWRTPLTWARKARAAGTRPRVFCASLADVFDNKVLESWRDDLWALIRATAELDWLLLTKRPQNMAKMLPGDWGDGYRNVWLGVTAENQTEANRRIPDLLKTPATLRFVSYAPALGPVDFTRIVYREDGADVRINALTGEAWVDNSDSASAYTDECDGNTKLGWIVAEGETGKDARPPHPVWFRSVRNHCAHAGVPFFLKHWGEWAPAPEGEDNFEAHRARGARDLYVFTNDMAAVELVGKKRAGRLLDGVEHNAFPESEAG